MNAYDAGLRCHPASTVYFIHFTSRSFSFTLSVCSYARSLSRSPICTFYFALSCSLNLVFLVDDFQQEQTKYCNCKQINALNINGNLLCGSGLSFVCRFFAKGRNSPLSFKRNHFQLFFTENQYGTLQIMTLRQKLFLCNIYRLHHGNVDYIGILRYLS